jgi:hypothetical protein
MKFWKYAPRSFFLEEHDHERRIMDVAREDGMCVEKFLNFF